MSIGYKRRKKNRQQKNREAQIPKLELNKNLRETRFNTRVANRDKIFRLKRIPIIK